jgi:hypothetical protein
MRRTTLAVLTVTALAAGSLAAAPLVGTATALTETKVTMQKSASWTVKGTSTKLYGNVDPARSDTGAKVKIQRKYSGSWHLVERDDLLHGAAYTAYIPESHGGFRIYRACVGATSTATADCSPSVKVFVGSYHYMKDLTPVSATAGFSTGGGTTDGITIRRALRFDVEAPQKVVYDLKGTCIWGGVGQLAVDDSAQIGHGYFSFSGDGKSLGTIQVQNGPVGSFQYKPYGIDRLKINTSADYVESDGNLLLGEAQVFCAWG